MAHSAHLIAVGVVESEAADLVRRLPGVHVDIGLITSTFENLGFLQSTVLIEGEGKSRQPTVRNIAQAFQGFGAQNIKRDVTIVYLSTHGYPVNGELYFVTADSRQRVGCSNEMETGTMLSLTQFRKLLVEYVRPHTKRLLVFIDTCHAGHEPLKGSGPAAGTDVQRTFDHYFGQALAAEGMATICACPGDSGTAISDENGGAFTCIVRDATEEVADRSAPPGRVALIPLIYAVQRKAKQANRPAPIFNATGIRDLEDFFIGNRAAATGMKATPKPPLPPPMTTAVSPQPALSLSNPTRSISGGPLRNRGLRTDTNEARCSEPPRPAGSSGSRQAKRKAIDSAQSSTKPTPSSSSRKRQRPAAPLVPPQESCGYDGCTASVTLKVVKREDSPHKGRRFWSCSGVNKGHYFQWWQVPNDFAASRSAEQLRQFAQEMGANPPKSADKARIVEDIKRIQK